MPIRPVDRELVPLYLSGRERLGDVRWFDAHTHIGSNDPDGRSATAEEILAGLDDAGHERALVFPMHEPGGYRDANDAVLRAAAASGGRLVALCRVSPAAEDAVAEARRCLEAGAAGIKLHPRSDAFGLPHPVVERLVALAHERRAPVLFHAGRGIPNLGEAVIDYAERYPGARLILAHAGISDLGAIAPFAARLRNLFFDTAWWHVSDLLQLYATVPPGRILYASDMPYGPGLFTAFAFMRCTRAVGLASEVVREMAGNQLARVVAGEEPVDLGPAPGLEVIGPRRVQAERAMSYIATGVQLAFRGLDPGEPLALARCACQTAGSDGELGALLALVDRLLVRAQELAVAHPEDPAAALSDAFAAMLLAGTPEAGVPDVDL